MGLELAVQEGRGTGERSRDAQEERLSTREQQQRVKYEEADRVEQDGECSRALGLRVLVGAAHDADVGAEVAVAILKVVARKGLEGLASEDRVHEEEELQRGLRGRLQRCDQSGALALKLEPAEGAQHNEANDHKGEHDPEEELGRVARDVEALEWGRLQGQIDAESADDGDAAVDLLDIVGHGDVVHVVHLR